MKKLVLLFCVCFLLMTKLATAQITNCVIVPSIFPVDTAVCPGSSVTLTASGGDSYSWSNGDTGSVITVNPTTDSVFIVNAKSGSCAGSDSDTIIVPPTPSLTILPNDTSVCNGQAAILYVTGGGIFYTWSPSGGLNQTTGDSVIATPTLTTTYTVLGYDSFGCNVTGSDEVIVLATPPIPTFTQDGDTLISSSLSGNQWYLNDTLFSTNKYLVITNNMCRATLYLTVTDPSTKCYANSDSVIIECEGIDRIELYSFIQLFPNPVNDIEFIKINSSAGDLSTWTMQLSDVLGRIIYKTESLNYLNEIDMSKIPSGIYFISITNQTGRAVFPVVKQE